MNTTYDPQAPLCIVIHDFREGSQQALGCCTRQADQQVCANYDLLIAIHAPEQLPLHERALQIYLDPCDSPTRNLHGDAWQVRCTEPLSPEAFAAWAQTVAGLLSTLLLEQYFVCVDLTDLLWVFRLVGQPFNCWLCDWDDTERLPEALRGKSFTHSLWVVLADANQLTMTLFSQAGTLLEQLQPEDGVSVGAARIQSAGGIRLMLVAA